MNEPSEPQPRQIQLTLKGLSRRQLLLGLGGAGLSVVLALIAITIIRPNLTPRGSAFTNSLLSQITTFKPYYLKPGFSTDFAMQPGSTSYKSGVLVFAMKNPAGKNLAFTEQAAPPNFDPSMLQTTKQFATEYGQALITDGPNRTTGTLFTSDHTWVIINAPNPIGADLMQQVLNALAPITHQK